jgi:hypothetical protein
LSGTFVKKDRLSILGKGMDGKIILILRLIAKILSFRPWILAKYEVDTFKDVYNMEDAIEKFPEVREYDHNFGSKQHKQELEVAIIIIIYHSFPLLYLFF